MRLTKKQQAFIEHYLTTWNATEAAIQAGYSEHTAAVIGSENLTKPKIRAAIDARLEKFKLSANDVLLMLSEHASGSMEDFVSFDWTVPRINLEQAAKRGKMHLVKKLSYDKDGRLQGIELYDAQSALVQLGRYHKLFTDKIEIVDWRKEAEESGIDVGELYQQLVNEIAASLATSSRGDDTRSLPGGAEKS